MRRESFTLLVLTRVRFTRAETAILMKMSQDHYDGKCKAASASGGVVYGMNQDVTAFTEEGQEGMWDLTTHDIGHLCKITEGLGRQKSPEEQKLHNDILLLLTQAGAKYQEINSEEKTS